MTRQPNSDHLENIPTTYIFFYNHSDQPFKGHNLIEMKSFYKEIFCNML